MKTRVPNFYPLSTTTTTITNSRLTLFSFFLRTCFERKMEGLKSQSLLQTRHQVLQCSFRSPSRVECEPKNYAVTVTVQSRFRSLTAKRTLPRRLFLRFMGFNPLISLLQPAFAAPMLEMKEPEVIRTLKLPSGVRIQEIIEGNGPEVRDGNVVEINYVCRRSNGYFVHSTVDQFSGESSPVVLPLDENQIIKGLKDVLIGMRVGGKRRALIPPSVGYVNENLKPIPEEFGPRRSLLSHSNEPLIFEVQLLKLL